MFSSQAHSILIIIILSSLWCFSDGRSFTFEMHHGFSEPVRKWVHSRSPNWPVKGTLDYYSALADRDRFLLRRRQLSSSFNGSVTFSDGNSTLRLISLGFLHYVSISLGTPAQKFFVALDTGSDLFWVPCDCSSCTLPPATSSSFPPDYEVEGSIYDPIGSSTSKKILCHESWCFQRHRCLGTFSDCPYEISYISADTSSSGVLVEDVLHLITEDGQPEVVEAWVIFGCGQVQTGLFINSAAPNGLFGLGMGKISVPSMLSRVGLTADSFSMCFGRDGFGRISFGDKGSLDQDETPFSLNLLHPTYTIRVTQSRIGQSLIDTRFSALFDSGTSFTYLADPAYRKLSECFNLYTQDSRLPPDRRIPFEYCYRMSSDANSSVVPSMSLMMEGGRQFPVYDPIIVISSQDELVYCLAILKSTDMNIIGQNFMTGYKVVFDREKLMLGWKELDCYNVEKPNILPSNLRNRTETLAAESRNDSQVTVQPTAGDSSSPHPTKYCMLLLLLHFLLFNVYNESVY